MPIPEKQLDTWAHQGSIVQSSTTYGIVKSTLEDAGTSYSSKEFEVFLQGSYGNDTNIYAESDVDIVIRLDSTFYHDLGSMNPQDQKAFHTELSDASYSHANFKAEVLATLKKRFGADVVPGTKAIKIKAGGSRRNADVIVAAQFRRYQRFRSLIDQQYDSGICFFTSSGERIVNYPKQHSANCTAKHQATGYWFKPMVRILKNMRSRLVQDGVIESAQAPSYFLEGLLYNVPNEKFGKTYEDTFVSAYNWLIRDADRTQLVCANEQYYLVRDTSVTWKPSDYDVFLTQIGNLWRNW